jgi:hypothetical protein
LKKAIIVKKKKRQENFDRLEELEDKYNKGIITTMEFLKAKEKIKRGL